MNFLSHYYFERYTLDSHQVLGGLLPDLLKNVDKNYNIQIHKHEGKLEFHPEAIAISQGWKRHVEVDRIFHNTEFFYAHTHRLRKEIEESIADLPIRASFLAHISLELLLDHLLIEKESVSVERLYEHLGAIHRPLLKKYFYAIGGIDDEKFFQFYDRFLASKYIFDYSKIENLPHALFNICKRVWRFDVTSKHLDDLALILDKYQSNHLIGYQDIFSEVQQKLG